MTVGVSFIQSYRTIRVHDPLIAPSAGFCRDARVYGFFCHTATHCDPPPPQMVKWLRQESVSTPSPGFPLHTTGCFFAQPTPYHECDRQGLAHAYSSAVPFIKDGLLFHLKAAHYQLGPTPLVLLWKDSSVARYLGVDSAQVCG